VASLGVPAIVRTPVARRSADGASELLTIRPIARLGLTFDHRAFDGAEALRALMSVQKTLENWPSEG
jgi:2-oxoglutarate dehydrogenase E2 component (dihydrolipoamide succinyltransferase)